MKEAGQNEFQVQEIQKVFSIKLTSGIKLKIAGLINKDLSFILPSFNEGQYIYLCYRVCQQ